MADDRGNVQLDKEREMRSLRAAEKSEKKKEETKREAIGPSVRALSSVSRRGYEFPKFYVKGVMYAVGRRTMHLRRAERRQRAAHPSIHPSSPRLHYASPRTTARGASI